MVRLIFIKHLPMNSSTSPRVASSSFRNNDSLHCIQASAARFRSLGVVLAFAVVCSIVLLPLTSSAQTTWNNTGSEWTSGTSWVGGAAPANSVSTTTNTAVFTNLAAGFNIVNLSSDRRIYGVLFTDGANAYTFTGGALSINGAFGITNLSANVQTFSNKVINASGNTTYGSYIAGGSLVFAGGIDLTDGVTTNNRTLTLGGSGNITVSGAIANGGTATAGLITVTNTALTTLSGNNTYGGTTLVSSGARLQLGNAGALGSTVGLTRVSSGGAIDLNGQTILGEGLTNSGTGVSSSGSLYNSSASAATWSGNITPSAGSTIKATNGSITLSGGIDLNNNAATGRTLTLEGAGGIVVSGNISNSFAGSTGGLTIGGTNGTFTLSGSNSYTGLTILTNTYTLRVTSVDALSSKSSLEGSSASARTATLDLATAGSYKMNSFQGGNINLLATNGASSLTFTNAGTGNLVTGGSRTITATNVAVTFDGSVDISPTDSAKTFTVAGNSDFTFNGSILTTNTGFSSEFRASSTGRTTLNASNNYDGLTTVSAGATLRLANSFAMGVANGLTNTVAVGGALELLGGITVNGEILDLNGRGVSDGGALRNISGNNTYNGPIELNSTNRINSDAGTLTVGAFTNGLNSSRDLLVGGAGNTVIAGALNGTGTGRLVKDGTGTLTISAANTVDGGTTVGAGTLVVSSSGSITASATNSVIISNGASLRYNGSAALSVGSVDLGAGGGLGRAVLGGEGTINSAVTLNALTDVLSPGNSPGLQNFATNQTWSSFTYDWELNNFTGTTAGTDFDKIVIAGTLNLSATTANSYGLNILSLTAGNVSGNVPNFAEVNTTWTILSADGALTGFDAAEWTINPSGFTTGTAYLGAFSLAQVGNELQLTYTVPEPSTYVLLGISALACGAWFIRRRRKS
jgi:autotransporter-associated beta strand protein